MSWPQITAVPLVGARKPVIIFIVVDLPAPLGPRNPSTSPSGTLNDTSSTAVSGPNFLTRLRISSMPRRSKSQVGNDHSKQPIAPELGRIGSWQIQPGVVAAFIQMAEDSGPPVVLA